MKEIFDHIQGILCLGIAIMITLNIHIIKSFEDVNALVVCVFIALANLFFNKARR